MRPSTSRQRRLLCWAGAAHVVFAVVFATTIEVLQSAGGVPAHVAGQFEEPVAYQRMASGRFVVFDRRAHVVYALDPRTREASRLVDIGPEKGRVLGPTAIATHDDMIVVADAPNLVERIQIFNEAGQRIGGFTLPGKASPRVTMGTMVLGGVASVQFTGRSLLFNQPETGALVTEYGLAGTPVRSFGNLRPTGQEANRDVHLALNVGLPLINPKGGYYFVFQSGEPRFRRYTSAGQLELERLIQGKEIDPLVAAIPTTWPTRRVGDEVLPVVPPIVRAAAVDLEGRLWVSFTVPYTYVFDEDGDKFRTVQFRGAGVVSPTSLFFAPGDRLLVTPGLYEFNTR